MSVAKRNQVVEAVVKDLFTTIPPDSAMHYQLYCPDQAISVILMKTDPKISVQVVSVALGLTDVIEFVPLIGFTVNFAKQMLHSRLPLRATFPTAVDDEGLSPCMKALSTAWQSDTEDLDPVCTAAAQLNKRFPITSSKSNVPLPHP